MTKNSLSIIEVSNTRDKEPSFPHSKTFEEDLTQKQQAKFERLWLHHAEQFNPMRNCMEKNRIETTWRFLLSHTDPQNKQAADIGCGFAIISRYLADLGAEVDAVDISENALKRLKETPHPHIHPFCDAMPNTGLEDEKYHLIVCTELIAELPPEEHRLFFAELSRLIKAEGLLFCSSDINIDTDEGVNKFLGLAQTEFDILDTLPSYHALHIRFKRALSYPSEVIEGWKSNDYRQKMLNEKSGLAFGWYWLNTTIFCVWFWYLVNSFATPLLKQVRHNQKFLLFSEKICRWISGDKGISNYLFVAKRRPLKQVDPNEIPIERLGKKEIWT